MQKGKRGIATYYIEAGEELVKNRMALCGLIVLAALFLMALIGPHLNNHTYFDTHLSLKNHPPSRQFWFGTDELGRDIFTRIWWGARISLFVGICAAFIDMIVGVCYGGIAAMIHPKIEEFMMRCADILYSLPQLLLTILLMVIMGSGITTILIALTLTGWINMARIIRGQILQVKQNEYVQAAQALGASQMRILGRHLIPNVVGSIITTATLTIPSAIFMEAFLSFLGLGVQAPFASWGTMASDGLNAMRYYPWRLFFPAAFISMAMLAFNMVGDGLRDAFDPRLKT